MYNGPTTIERTESECGVSAEFPVPLGLHQGSALSPFQFVVVPDVLSESVRKEELWELF